MRRSVLLRVLLSLVLAALVISGCGSGSPAPAPKDAAKAPAAAPAAPAQPAPATKPATPAPAPAAKPAAPKQMTKVSIAQAQALLAYAPLYVARAKGFFQEEGIDLTVEVLPGSTQVIQAVSSDSVPFGTAAAPDFLNLVTKKPDMLAVQHMIRQTVNMVTTKKLADKFKLTRASPIMDRIKALKGTKIATTGPAALSETLPKWLVARAGMNPEKDIEVIAIGGAAARQAALQTGNVDAYASSGPTPEEAEAKGFGYVLIPASHLPNAKDWPHEIVFAKTAWLEKNPDLAKRFVRALNKGGEFAVKNKAEGIQALRTFFDKVDVAVLSDSIDNIVDQIVVDGSFKQSEWDFVVKFYKEIGTWDKGMQVDTKEGVYWTNKYLK